jgi:hypothetical protein
MTIDAIRMTYEKIFPTLTFFHSLEIKMQRAKEITKYNIGIIENDVDDSTAPFRPSMEYAKITWSKGIIKLQKYSVKNVDIIT